MVSNESNRKRATVQKSSDVAESQHNRPPFEARPAMAAVELLMLRRELDIAAGGFAFLLARRARKGSGIVQRTTLVDLANATASSTRTASLKLAKIRTTGIVDCFRPVGGAYEYRWNTLRVLELCKSANQNGEPWYVWNRGLAWEATRIARQNVVSGVSTVQDGRRVAA